MRIRMPLLGSGTLADPWRVALPTYVMLEPVDYAGKLAVVEIPDADHPFTGAEIAAAPKVDAAFPTALTTLPAPQRTRWNQHLDTRYQEHAGQFRPVPQ